MNSHILSFIEYLQVQRRMSKHTSISYKNDLDNLSVFLANQYDLYNINDITYTHLRSYIVFLMKSDTKEKSINRKISCFRSFYKYLIRNEIVSVNPMLKIIGPKIPKRLPEYVQSIDITSIFDLMSIDKDYLTLRDNLIFTLFYQTGMRRAELISLTDSSFDNINSRLTIIGKGNKERIVPLITETSRKITEYIDVRDVEVSKKSKNLFLTSKGTPLYPKLVYNIIKGIMSLVSTNTKQSPHILRHTFATHMANNGAELNAIKELLGHASLAATQVYTHNSIEKLKDVYKKSHPKAES